MNNLLEFFRNRYTAFFFIAQVYELIKYKMFSSKVELSAISTLDFPKALAKWMSAFRHPSGAVLTGTGHCIKNDWLCKPKFDIKTNQIAIFDEIPEFNNSLSPLIRMNGILNGLSDYDSTYQLGEALGVDDNMLSRPKITPGSGWTETLINKNVIGLDEQYDFHNTKGVKKLSVVADNNGTPVPINLWQRPGDLGVRLCHFLPEEKMVLYNLPSLNYFKGADVVVSEHLKFIHDLRQQTIGLESYIQPTSWFGGKETLPGVDLTPLENRNVGYVLCNLGVPEVETAIHFFSKLDELKGAALNFINLNVAPDQNGFQRSFAEAISKEQLIQIARKLGITIPENIDVPEFEVNSSGDPDNTDDVKMLMSPFLEEAIFGVFYAPPERLKSLGTMSMALALTQGFIEVFQGTGWKTCDPVKVLIVDAENGLKRMKMRDKLLSPFYIKNKKLQKNLFYLCKQLDLTAKTGQEALVNYLKKLKYQGSNNNDVSVLFLDNLGCLTPKAEREKGFNELYNFICYLREAFNLAVFGIHHTDKEGKDMRGASQIRDRAEVVVRFDKTIDTPEFKKLVKNSAGAISPKDFEAYFRLTIDKGRHIPPEMKKPFDIKLDTFLNKWIVHRFEESDNSTWKSRSDEDKIKGLKRCKALGYTDEQIAQRYSVSRKTITNFKNKHNILDRDIKE